MSEQKVRELAKLAILSGRISEIHEKNMKSYPFALFNGVLEAKVDYDLEKGSKNYIKYDLKMKHNSENPSQDKYCSVLERCLQNLFWKEVSVEVLMNGKKIYPTEKVEESNG